MSPRNNPVGINTLCCTANDRLKILPEIGWREVGVEILGGHISQVFGKFGRVVAAKAPGQLVFGKISGDVLDGIEGVCFTGLSGCENPVVNHFLRDLLILLAQAAGWDWCQDRRCTYVVPSDFLFAKLLEKIVDLVLSGDGVVGENHLVQSPVVDDNVGHVATNVSQVCDGGWGGAIADNLIVCRGHGIVDPSGVEAGVGELIPPTDIDDCVRQEELLDVVVDGLFL